MKALGNDIEKNLREPLTEISALARSDGLSLPEIRVAVRSGDTPQSRRQAMLKRPPHILVTTPESLYILLTSAGGRRLLAPVRTLIVDEIHSVARDKRGAHLALSLERLESLATRRPQRIGLSATQNPIEEIARFLVGSERVAAEGVNSTPWSRCCPTALQRAEAAARRCSTATAYTMSCAAAASPGSPP